MTNKEALEALLKGKKITKQLWLENSEIKVDDKLVMPKYIYFDFDKDRIVSEEGVYFDVMGCEFMIYEEPILDEEEKAYLSAVIKPFKDRVIYIEKGFVTGSDPKRNDWKFAIQIRVISYNKHNEDMITLPYFHYSSSMYGRMKTHKKYTLKELGLSD